MMKFTLLRYALVLTTFGSFTFLGGSNRSVAQNYPAISEVDPAQSPPVEPPGPALQEMPSSDDSLGYQAMLQGPVHEAFAAPVQTDHTLGTRLFDRPPPAVIDEQPPETKSDVAGMKWIPGQRTLAQVTARTNLDSRLLEQNAIGSSPLDQRLLDRRGHICQQHGAISSRPTPIDRQRA
jgi:hypothetical protein